ncbi:MAG TPA: EAL domain-containing protein [Burkholderiales bacterium]|nr:EAL domain-containing protein [Burkholderiales bacterium]
MSAKDVDPLLQKEDAALMGWTEPAERLRLALAKNELTLFCQPIAALSGPVRFPMAEVLVRLREEEKALLPPGEFIPVFEHYRLMPDLDRWVVREVLRQLKQGLRIPRFTINLSSQTVDDPEFAKAVALALIEAGVPGKSLLFEIGESDTLQRLEAAIRLANGLRAVGCGIMVGGFGRRTATFAPLKALKPDFVKVDGVIVRKLLSAPAVEDKLKAILRVGEVMGYAVVAEMVEEQDILTRLKALGVAYAQGFGIRQPHPVELIQNSRPAA